MNYEKVLQIRFRDFSGDDLSMLDKVIFDSVKATLHQLSLIAPGRAIEVRIPPYAAIQCGDGPTHTRGTPPNVIEMDAETWLALADGSQTWTQALTSDSVRASGARADLSSYLPLRILA